MPGAKRLPEAASYKELGARFGIAIGGAGDGFDEPLDIGAAKDAIARVQLHAEDFLPQAGVP